jgi:hypothetical protein
LYPHEAEAKVYGGFKLSRFGIEIQPLTDLGLINLAWRPEILDLRVPVMIWCRDFGGNRAKAIAAAAPPPAIAPPRTAPVAAAKPEARKSHFARDYL